MSKTRILIVEDEPIISQNLKKMLTLLGYKVTGIISYGEQVLPHVESNGVDLILMDIYLAGGMDGIDTAKQLLGTHDIPIIYLTGDNDEATLKRARVSNPFGYLIKPIKKANLQSAIEIAICHHNTEKMIKHSEIRYKRLFEESNDAIFIHDTNGKILDVNHKASEMLGYKRVELLSMRISELHPKNKQQKMADSLKRLIENNTSRYESRYIKRDKTTIIVDVSSSVINQEKNIIQKIVRDITRQNTLKKELEKNNSQLKKLYHHLQYVREKERKKISRKIHDNIGQFLTGLGLEVESILESYPKNKKIIFEKLRSFRGLIEEATEMVRELSLDLRPIVLDDFGLAAALKNDLKRLQAKTKIKFKFINANIRHINQRKTNILYSIFKELTTNIIRHAQATEVEMGIKKENNQIIFWMKDNGKGITKKQINSPYSLGIIGIREQVEFLKGSFVIAGNAKKGTFIEIRLP